MKFSCLMIGAVLFSTAMLSAAPATSLTVGENFVNPIGFHDATPTFSWKLPAGVKRQTAYRIEVKSGDAPWDSGWVSSDQSIFVVYPGKPFASRQRAEWRVNFKDEEGKEGGWSEPAKFEVGLLSAVDWKAKWIRPAGESDPGLEAVGYLRRSFSITKKVERARVYVTARGLFELQLNGKQVGDDHFANGFTAYDKRIDTLTYDITGQLKQGDNTLGGLLGKGWYAGRFPFAAKAQGPYGKDAALLVQVEISYADGTSEVIISDEKWEGTFTGPIISSSIYDGEIYDARRNSIGWAPVVADAELGAAALVPKPFIPVREEKTLTVQQILPGKNGSVIFDLGQNMVGWARIKLPVVTDQTLTIRVAEILKQDGTLYTENYRSAKSVDSYTAAQAGVIEWEPTFTFHGFRYVELVGLPAGAKPQKEWVTGVVLHSPQPQIGKFESSHAKLNQLQSNITWGWRGNSLDIPTDCPQRDERMGWTGDAQVFAATAMFNYDNLAFWKSWLRSVRDEQKSNGLITDVVPTAGAKFNTKSPGWMDVATITPWDIYVRTGDVEVLAENYGMMEKLIGWYRSQAENNLLPKTSGYGDWLQPYQVTPANPKENMSAWKGDTAKPLLGAAYYAYGAKILADTAKLLNRPEDAKRYADEATAVREAFVKQFFDADGKVQNAVETQTSYALAITFDLLPADLKAKAGNHLARLVREADGHLRTGFLGTSHLAPALDETGHADVAFGLVFKETYPSWFYSINQGATTMWERWNSYSHEKGFGDVKMNSFNHYAYGAIGQWLYERVAGLTPDPANPGYKHFFIRPQIGGPLTSAKAELDTPYGIASSAWKKQGSKLVLDAVVPPNTTATIEFPTDRKKEIIGPGKHHFELELN